jgi:hypothetical protein
MALTEDVPALMVVACPDGVLVYHAATGALRFASSSSLASVDRSCQTFASETAIPNSRPASLMRGFIWGSYGL